jgi:hypothetical protein
MGGHSTASPFVCRLPNLSFQGAADKLRLRVPSALRAPAAGYLKR